MLAFADFDRSPGPVTSCPNGLGRGGVRHAREDHLRRRLRKPDRRLRSLALPFDESSTARRRSYDVGGCVSLVETPQTRLPRAPAGHTGFRGVEQGARSASPMSARSGGSTRRWRRGSCCETRTPTRRTRSSVLTARVPSRTREPGRSSLREAPSTRRASSPRDASNFQANNPLFKERAPELHVAFRPSRLSPEGRRVSRFMALHSLRIALARVGGGVLLRLRARTGFPLTPHFRIACCRTA